MGAAPLANIAFDFFLETESKLLFRMRVSNAQRRRASFAYVVAKNTGVFSERLEAEHANLGWLHERVSRYVLTPLRGGTVYLPDRHRRAGHGREVFAYLASWPAKHHELGLGPNLQFFVGGKTIQPITEEQTDILKGRMAGVVAGTYHPQRHYCIETPDLLRGDFLATRPQQGAMRVKLVTCRGIRKGMTPATVLHRILSKTYTFDGQKVRLAPNNPGTPSGGPFGSAGKRIRTELARALTGRRSRRGNCLNRNTSLWLNWRLWTDRRNRRISGSEAEQRKRDYGKDGDAARHRRRVPNAGH